MNVKGIAYRLLATKYIHDPISGIITQKFDGRYHPREAFRAVYLSDSLQTLHSEIYPFAGGKEEVQSFVIDSQRLFVEVEYCLKAVVSLLDPEVLNLLKIERSELVANWREKQLAGELAMTQQLGYKAYQLGFIEALKVPSVTNPEGYNLVVFLDRLQQDSYLHAHIDKQSVASIYGEIPNSFVINSIHEYIISKNSEKGLLSLALDKDAEINYQHGIKLLEDGSWHEGLEYLETSYKIWHQLGRKHALANSIYQIARVNQLMGNHAKARMHYRDALRLYQRTQDQDGAARCEIGLGLVLLQMGYIQKSQQYLTTAKKYYHNLNDLQRVDEIEKLIQISNQYEARQLVYEQS
jgi:RES domain-containing protein